MYQVVLVRLLKIAAFLIFFGRGYQYLFFDAPFRALLWDESLLEPIVEGWFNTPWNDYVTNLRVDAWIQTSVRINGVLFVLAALSSWFITAKNKRFLKYPIVLGGFFLVVLSFLSTKEHFYHFAQFFEHAIQFGVPFVLLFALRQPDNYKKTVFWLKVLIAVTFTSHGLYALGVYPIPGYFIDMTINSLGVTEPTAVLILKAAGILDIVLSIAIFLPRISRYALMYAVFWGFATALARIVSNFNADLLLMSVHQTFYLTLYRLPHGLLPLLVLIVASKFYQRTPGLENPKMNVL